MREKRWITAAWIGVRGCGSSASVSMCDASANLLIWIRDPSADIITQRVHPISLLSPSALLRSVIEPAYSAITFAPAPPPDIRYATVLRCGTSSSPDHRFLLASSAAGAERSSLSSSKNTYIPSPFRLPLHAPVYVCVIMIF